MSHFLVGVIDDSSHTISNYFSVSYNKLWRIQNGVKIRGGRRKRSTRRSVANRYRHYGGTVPPPPLTQGEVDTAAAADVQMTAQEKAAAVVNEWKRKLEAAAVVAKLQMKQCEALVKIYAKYSPDNAKITDTALFNKTAYEIFAMIDAQLIETDSKYCNAIVEALLNIRRFQVKGGIKETLTDLIIAKIRENNDIRTVDAKKDKYHQDINIKNNPALPIFQNIYQWMGKDTSIE